MSERNRRLLVFAELAFTLSLALLAALSLGSVPLPATSVVTDCLMQEKGANIVSGAKVVVKRNDEGISNNKYSVYLKQIKPPQSVSPDGKSVTTSQVQFHSYNIEKRFAARPWDISGNLICTEYSYWESGFQMSPQESCDANDATPPATYNYDWRSRIYLQPGKPQIAAAVQNKDNVVFLVLTATIQNDIPTPTPAAEERKK